MAYLFGPETDRIVVARPDAKAFSVCVRVKPGEDDAAIKAAFVRARPK